MSKRYQNLKKLGIRKDLKTGKYQARTTVKGKQYSRLFETVKAAQMWKASFDPKTAIQTSNKTPTIAEVWEEYKQSEFPSLELSSRETKEHQIKVFWNELANMEEGDISPSSLSTAIAQNKKRLTAKSRRCNYNLALDQLKVLFNWYRENVDYTFISPIQKRHYKQGIVKKIVKKRRYLSPEDIALFINSFDKRMYRNMALLQFLLGCRICEIAGLQKSDVDFKAKVLEIKHTVVWSRYNRKFAQLKPYTKNGESKEVPLMNQDLITILQEQLEISPCEFLFCDSKAQPLSYRMIQFQFNKALKKAGLEGKASSTHFLRHSAATGTRDLFGLEAAQAILGHKDIRTTQVYAQLPTKLIGQSIEGMSQALDLKNPKWIKNGSKSGILKIVQ